MVPKAHAVAEELNENTLTNMNPKKISSLRILEHLACIGPNDKETKKCHHSNLFRLVIGRFSVL